MADRMILGWAFRSPLSLNEMKKRLDAAGPEPWSVGDSERYGDYLAGTLTAHGVARIYELRDGYIVNLRFFSTEGNPVSQLATATDDLLNRVLLLAEARDVRSTDPLE